MASIVVNVVMVYLLAGVVFAVYFAWRGAGRIDAAAGRGTWGFRLLLLPGATLLWPWLGWRVWRHRGGAKPGTRAKGVSR